MFLQIENSVKGQCNLSKIGQSETNNFKLLEYLPSICTWLFFASCVTFKNEWGRIKCKFLLCLKSQKILFWRKGMLFVQFSPGGKKMFINSQQSNLGWKFWFLGLEIDLLLGVIHHLSSYTKWMNIEHHEQLSSTCCLQCWNIHE